MLPVQPLLWPQDLSGLDGEDATGGPALLPLGPLEELRRDSTQWPASEPAAMADAAAKDAAEAAATTAAWCGPDLGVVAAMAMGDGCCTGTAWLARACCCEGLTEPRTTVGRASLGDCNAPVLPPGLAARVAAPAEAAKASAGEEKAFDCWRYLSDDAEATPELTKGTPPGVVAAAAPPTDRDDERAGPLGDRGENG